jgi:hypothetical protein
MENEEKEPTGEKTDGAVVWSKESIDELVKKDDGFNKAFSAYTDSRITQALKTNSAKLQKEFDDKILTIRDEIRKELNPTETQADRIAKEALRQVEEERRLRQSGSLQLEAVTYANNKGMVEIGNVFKEMIIGSFDVSKVDNEKVLNYLDRLYEAFEKSVNERLKKLKGANAVQPGAGDENILPTSQEGWANFWKNHTSQADFLKYRSAYDNWANSQKK